MPINATRKIASIVVVSCNGAITVPCDVLLAILFELNVRCSWLLSGMRVAAEESRGNSAA